MAVKQIPSSRNSLIVPLVLLFAVLVALIAATVVFRNEQREALTKRRELQSLQRDLINLDSVLVDQKTYAGEISAIEKTLPATPQDVSEALAQFESLATGNGLTYDAQVEDAINSEPGGVRSVKITVKLTGSYTGLANWVSGVSNLLYHTKIDSLDLEGGKGKLETTVILRLFVQ